LNWIELFGLNGRFIHMNCSEPCVRLLLKYKADVDAKDGYGRTALYWTAGGKHEAVVRLLLEYTADVDAKDKDRKTALHRAAAVGARGGRWRKECGWKNGVVSGGRGQTRDRNAAIKNKERVTIILFIFPSIIKVFMFFIYCFARFFLLLKDSSIIGIFRHYLISYVL
jgi:hypothetical protein